MTFDPVTILILSSALAAAATLYLAVEWFSVREASLLFWSAGFAIISAGSALALLRSSGFLLVGIWFANGGLIVAHWLFLAGVSRLMHIRLARVWYLIILVWLAMLVWPHALGWSKVMLCIQSLLIAGMTLHASLLLRPYGSSLSVGAVQLRYVLLMHGLFYVAKAVSSIVLGSNLDLATFQGVVIKISLGEGLLAIILIALSMTGTERHRREQLTLHDPLTGLYNRRALEMHAAKLFEFISSTSPGAFVLISIDNFKQVNYLHGHRAGDKLLLTLGELIRATLPSDVLVARLGGDEFVILLRGLSGASVTTLSDDLRKAFAQMALDAFPTPNSVNLNVEMILFERPPESVAALLEQGRAAVHESKRARGDGVLVMPSA
jgi:diguanylate cyclase (GGDEF)-like protein